MIRPPPSLTRTATLDPYTTVFRSIVDFAGQAARLIEGELSPLRYGSDAGCIYGDGAVRTPAGYRDFYRKFVVGGWCGITHRPEHGGDRKSTRLNSSH